MTAGDRKISVTGQPETGRALVACHPPSERAGRRAPTDAAFLAQLLAIKLDVPMYRQRRREASAIGAGAYRAPAPAATSALLIDA